MLPSRFTLLLAAFSTTALLLGACSSGDGGEPDCPQENFTNPDGSIDQEKFDAWQQDMVEAGCLTPIGGTWNQGGAGGGQAGSPSE